MHVSHLEGLVSVKVIQDICLLHHWKILPNRVVFAAKIYISLDIQPALVLVEESKVQNRHIDPCTISNCFRLRDSYRNSRAEQMELFQLPYEDSISVA